MIFKKDKKNKSAFTLVELVVVIAILGILAAIAIPKMGTVQKNAKIKADIAIQKAVEDFFIKGPNVYTFIDKLSFKDHRGLVVENITADFTYTKKNILLEQLEMKTPLSEMKGRVELKYNRKDFSDFNNKVVFDVQFDKATIASNDLNYFYNEFGKNNVFYVDTHLVGTLNNFTTYNLKLVDKHQSEIIGTANFRNLFGKGNQEFYMKGNFDRITSNYEDLKSILPRILGNNLPSVLAKLGNVNISGAVELTQQYINADVLMLSQLGYLEGNLAMQNINNIDITDT